jgi:integrase
MCGTGSAGRAGAVRAATAPLCLSEPGRVLVGELVASAAPPTRARSKALLFAASRLVGFAERLGLELSGDVVLSEPVIERLVLEGCEGLSLASVRTLRTNLRWLARALERYPQPAPVPLVRERAKAPYSPAEIAGFLRLADAQATRARRMRSSALVCLGAGAGIVAGELRHVRGSDVVVRAGGVLVQVGGARARAVPVLGRYQQRLFEAAAFAGGRYVIGGRNPERRNVTDALSAMLSLDSSLPRLQAGRLRSTWLVECAERIGLGAFMHAAGITCSQRLGDLAAQLPAVSEAELVAMLAGAG